MKHLKSYGIFESKRIINEDLLNQIESYLSDVFLELEDNGFEFTINLRSKDTIFLLIRKVPYYSDGLKYDLFKTSEVLSAIEHTISYLSDISFKLHIDSLDIDGVMRALIKTESVNKKFLPKGTSVIEWELITVKDLEEKDYECREIRLVFKYV